MSEEESLVMYIMDHIWDDFFDEENDYDIDVLVEEFREEIKKLDAMKKIADD